MLQAGTQQKEGIKMIIDMFKKRNSDIANKKLSEYSIKHYQKVCIIPLSDEYLHLKDDSISHHRESEEIKIKEDKSLGVSFKDYFKQKILERKRKSSETNQDINLILPLTKEKKSFNSSC